VKKLPKDSFKFLVKRPGALCSNDAKSCCDLIGHMQAALAMQSKGVPKAAIDCLFTALLRAVHRVWTGYGDSSSTYGGDPTETTINGICQGNGAGPAFGRY
jgi:hypothetical protein